VRWFDAHLDLACLAVCGRDMTAPLDELLVPKPKRAVGPWGPPAVTLPSLREGGVTECLATIFTEPGGTGPEGYPKGDVDAAHEAGLRQLRIYQNWVHDAGIRLARFDGHDAGDDGAGDGTPAAQRAYRSKTATHTEHPISIGILIENADIIRDPSELPWWIERGVIAIGMAWWNTERYAGGNGTDLALSDLGRALLQEMVRLGVLIDLSHLSQPATDEVLSRTDGLVAASHSNCRALLGGDANPAWQRHLSDATIREIDRRGGVIGLNLCRNFLRFDPSWTKGDGNRPTLDETLAHVEHICDLLGHTRCVGLGSDMDGGFSAREMCEGVERPADLERLADGLRKRGWTDEQVAGFARENWRRVLRSVRPGAVAAAAGR
jgi:membrane dipeptidase